MDSNNSGHGELHRALKNRHIQLIALGGAIGTGLFLGTSVTIKMAGPAVILGYAIGGFMAFLIMRQLGDMVAEEPVAGSFSFFAYKYWSDFTGFLAGWNYWILYVLVGISELTAAAAYMEYWWPGMPTWATAMLFFVLINAINMATVKAFGEMEFWFAIIKVVAIIAMIVFGAYILFLHTDLVPGASIKNLWMAPTVGEPGPAGFMPNGIHGLIIALPIIMFSFGGLELVGITAAEADDPQKVIPKAVNQVIYRILIFYIGTLTVLLSLYHWSHLVTSDQSPFVMIFDKLGFKAVAGTLNFVVLTAALSVFNSCVYCNSRMLYGLAQQGNAPRWFATATKRGVPLNAMTVAAILTFFVVPLNYFVPSVHKAFLNALSLVVAALLINWAMISLSHLKFRQAKDREGHKTVFPALLYPAGNYICLALDLFVLAIMFIYLDMKAAVIAVPVWIVIVYIGYLVLKRKPASVTAGK